jgi:hypothetical protein
MRPSIDFYGWCFFWGMSSRFAPLFNRKQSFGIKIIMNTELYYLYINDFISWNQAQNYTKNSNGYLATLTSSAESTFVYNNLVNNNQYWTARIGPWIGGFKNSGSWNWVSAEPWIWTNWQPGEPNNSNGVEGCLHFINI